MKIFFVYILLMHDTLGEHRVTAFVHKDTCDTNAQELNAKVGDHRAMHWDCVPQAVER